MRSRKTYYFDDISTVFTFGKHYGEPLCSVISHSPSYIYWCINTIQRFRISKETLQQIRVLFPDFLITDNFRDHIGLNYYEDEEDNNGYDDSDNGDDNWRSYEDTPTYERYGGSYAQDVMGYSDDDIDTIFDGDPSAYWNID